jgi:hypothetical protein
MAWERVHEAVERFVRAETAPPFAEGIAEVIELAAAERPHADWAKLRALDSSAEPPRLRAWFEAPLYVQPPERPLHGLFFNVCNPLLENGDVTTDLEFSGTSKSAAEDRDWIFTQFYEPGYASSAFLHELYGIAYGSRDFRQPVAGVLGNQAEYPLGLAYAALAVREVMRERTANDVANAAPTVSVAAGFAAGDIALVGELTTVGFIPNRGALWG